MQLQDFSLTRKERKLLKLSSDSWVLESPEHERLLRLKLVEQELACNPGYIPQPTGRIKATALGVDYLKYSRAHFFEKWVPYWVTTSISIVALIIAVISLLSELGLIQLPHP